jgi:hypothetical protein
MPAVALQRLRAGSRQRAKCANAALAIFAAKADLAEHHKIAHGGERPGVLRSE